MIVLGPVPKPKPLGKPKPKPKPHLTSEGEEFYTDWNANINDWSLSHIEVFGYIDGGDFAPLTNQEVTLSDGRIMVVADNVIQSIS